MSSAADSRSTVAGPLAGDLVAGKYRISGILGEGGMGRVLAAVNVTTGKNVALKWVLNADSPDAVARFAREARAAGRIHHANVVDVYDVVQHEGATCLVMELLRGESLSAILQRDVRLLVSEAVGIAIEAARGLDAAHRESVIHRDLKPANLFLCSGGGNSRVKVLDFGISKVSDADDLSPVTRTGIVLGTPHYMSPEQVRGMKNIDHRVDVYALGAVLYEMLAGRPPLDHDIMTALLVDIATIDPAPIETLRDEVPPDLSAVISRALSKEPDKRYPDVATFAKALEPFGDGTKFDPESRDWSQRISTERANADKSDRFSRAATMPATPAPVSSTAPIVKKGVPRAAIALAAAGAIALVALLAVATWVLLPSGDEPELRPEPPPIAHEEPPPPPRAPAASPVARPEPPPEPPPTTGPTTEPVQAEARQRRGTRASAHTKTQQPPAQQRNTGRAPPRAGTLSVDDF